MNSILQAQNLGFSLVNPGNDLPHTNPSSSFIDLTSIDVSRISAGFVPSVITSQNVVGVGAFCKMPGKMRAAVWLPDRRITSFPAALDARFLHWAERHWGSRDDIAIVTVKSHLGLMQINVGYELNYEFPQPTPMIITLNVHYSRVSDLVVPDHMHCSPSVAISSYRDGFGNWCNRTVAPRGHFRIWANGIVNDPGTPDVTCPEATQCPVQLLPEETLVFLLGSRYCETDCLSDIAWKLFSGAAMGWGRVQAICDFVHQHIEFGYDHADPTRTAFGAYNQRRGVCRDFAHLAVAFCRCMNIPARYCTGYLGDIGMPPPYAPMDFAAWFEAFLGNGWYTFDPRNNTPRIGRVLIARGRDAADVALATTFGPNTLRTFGVTTCETNGQLRAGGV